MFTLVVRTRASRSSRVRFLLIIHTLLSFTNRGRLTSHCRLSSRARLSNFDRVTLLSFRSLCCLLIIFRFFIHVGHANTHYSALDTHTILCDHSHWYHGSELKSCVSKSLFNIAF
ncbi:unnamed protein product [Chrysodeixis includens]|uniref:Uncharacterized protein n=1 Tax=Chrysodeixis includens TaxID=689277 RepID=A0A9N8KXL6_CHRIL|nr:unnamed protein product [Chrysodeixis includens]